MHTVFGRIHVALLNARGQGTVEYVALILLVALVMAGVVAAMKGFKTDEGKELGDIIIGKIKEAVRKVQFSSKPRLCRENGLCGTQLRDKARVES